MAAIDSGPVTCSWRVYAGDSNRQAFTFHATVGVPWDLTGAELQAQSRAVDTDATVAVEAVCTVVDATAGLATVEWDGELVRALLAGEPEWEGVWDLQIVEAGETLPVTLLRGAWTASMDVTRD